VQQLAFAAPWVLWGLLLLPLLPGRTQPLLWGLRLFSLALLLIALAQPTLRLGDAPLGVLIDVSQSVGGGALEAAAELSETLRFDFAGETAAAGQTGDADAQRQLETSRTDIARALQVAAAAGAGRILLVSDGAESQGDALASLPEVPVDVLYTPSLGNVRLRELLAPPRLGPGAQAEVVAVVESDRDTVVTLRPRVGGRDLPPVQRRVGPGQTPLRFSVSAADAAGGVLSVEASLELPFAQPQGDDLARTEIDVAEDDPVLVIGDPALSEVLRTQGLRVVQGGPARITAPLRYSAIILRESAGAFSPGQLELLRSYVEEGGGLMMAAGPESFGLGGWYRTPVEAVLPVSTDVRSNVELPLVALVIVMDRSQSMTAGAPSRLELAKEGAIEMVDLAYERDQLGFITFSDREEWVFRLREATQQGKREMLEAILNVQAGGGTVLEPAYRAALRSLRESPATIKHVILLSDGRLSDGGSPFSASNNFDFSVLAAAARRDGITTSSIAIGGDADTERLAAIAGAGGGRYYEALDVETLPRIFTGEALTATRSLLRSGPLDVGVRAHPLTPSGLAPPAVDAYVATTLKEGSDIIFEGEAGEAVLALSRQGLGRSAALTTDLNAYAGAFGRWADLPGVLGTVTRWLQVRPETYEVTATPEGNGLRVVLDAVAGGEFVNGERLSARYGGQEVALEQVAPGRYEALIGGAAGAQAGGSLSVSRGGEVVARTQVSAPDSEFDTDGGRSLLREIAARTGGEVIEDASTYAPALPLQRSAVWMWPALTGLGVFLLELTLRRLTGRTTA
jgi:Ca-activated chloride channel homolog